MAKMFFQEKKALAWAGCRKGNSTFYIACDSVPPEAAERRPSGASAERHSFLQYAITHFRETHSRGRRESASMKLLTWRKSRRALEWTWKEITDKVKYSPFPITCSLLKLKSDYLNRLAVDGFKAIMRYMGDLPMGVRQRDIECVYILLVMCHHHPVLRDETVCQLIKQTTNNKSLNPESSIRGWRLLSFLLSFFRCSDGLMPYLRKYLDSAAQDPRRTEQEAARVCLFNLHQTEKYGGRRNVPTEREVNAIGAEGHSTKEQKYYLPGGVQVVLSTSSSTVVQDVIGSVCREMGLTQDEDVAEFSLYCIVEGDESTLPLERDEYVLDLTAELERNGHLYYLVFCRSLWCREMRLRSELYTELLFHQLLPDYLEGYYLLPSSPTAGLGEEINRIAHLLHRATGVESAPTEFDLIQLVPKPVLKKRGPEFDPEVWNEATALTAIEAKAQCLELLQKWTLFGSCFFAAKIVGDTPEEEESILAVNRSGIHVLHRESHEILWRFSFSAARFRPSGITTEGTEIELGDLHFKKTLRLRMDHAHEIGRLIRQYDTFLHGASGPAVTIKV